MYWLFTPEQQEKTRESIDNLVLSLSQGSHKPPHSDQVFPFQGRKAINHAKLVIETLTNEENSICDPFVGSGSFAYAGAMLNRTVYANEFEIYTNRMAYTPFNLPKREILNKSFTQFISHIKPTIDYYYRTKCNCGRILPLDSLFFDRNPKEYINIAIHERLGKLGENVIFRQKHKCPVCKTTEKKFNEFDQNVLDELELLDDNFFDFYFIENSRINLNGDFLEYKNLFPKRSRLVLTYIWSELQKFTMTDTVKRFIENVFLSIINFAKYKDYRSKSQDLHCPPQKLRENNILNGFINQFKDRSDTLYQYNINNYQNLIFEMKDYRDFLSSLPDNTIDLIITDPPWNDGNAYFERAQLYHPWLGYNLKNDQERLNKEMIVSNSPERLDKRDKEQWWSDIKDLFESTYKVLKVHSFLILYFRPVPSKKWIENFNRLKLLARVNGFEPLLTCDLANDDPSMRIQQSAHYAFSNDLILTFIKLNDNERRIYVEDYDLDEIAFRVAVELQDELSGDFSSQQWNQKMNQKIRSLKLLSLALPKNRELLLTSFNRVCELRNNGRYLPKASTPYSDEIFNIPYIERVSLYIPYVIEELLTKNDKFTFAQFLLKIAEFVENGTRSILKDILNDSENSVLSLLTLYAEPVEGGMYFTKRPRPEIPSNIINILELDPYEFEIFVANLLELEGYSNVVVSGRAGDRGVDVRCNNENGDLVIVQCKRYTKSKVDAVPIQRLHSFALTRGATKKICITTTDFTINAYEEAELAKVDLINRDALDRLIHKHKIFHTTET